MKKKISIRNRQPLNHSRHGFTLVELLLGSSIMLIIIVATLSLYMRSNKVAVDQQQLAEVQHDVRSSMFFISRDCRSAGVGLASEIAGYFLEGMDGYGPSPESADSIKLMGNFDDPLNLRVRQYQGGGGGGAATAFLYDWELEKSPYDCPDFYENKQYIIISTTCPGCWALRHVSQNSVHGCGSGTAHFNMQPGQSELNPPGGFVDTGCAASCYDDAIITIGQIKQYWLDTTGNPGDYPDLNLSVGDDGYLGVANTLYLTTVSETGSIMHLPLAQNIENLQFRYNGDINDDGNLDGFSEWNNTWTIDQITRIRQVQIWVLGRTPNPFVSVSGEAPANLHLYRRPVIANSNQPSQDDKHRRFLLESIASVRNMSLNIYNTGTR